MINRLSTSANDFNNQLEKLLAWEVSTNKEVITIVTAIIDNVRTHGDQAIIDYSNKFDNLSANTITDLTIEKKQIIQAYNAINKNSKQALQQAATRINNYHQQQKQQSWSYTDESGATLGQKITPITNVGLYVPGGKASYPSSVLMNAIPAKVAGVKNLTMVAPTPNGYINPMVLAAAHIVDIDNIFSIGGAQAIAALAYGTKTIKKVDKIVGPGNIYVATAKRQVFGQVGIDMIAGPSEILIICDASINPDWIAMDLFSQAEHDEDAQAIMLCADEDYITKVEHSIKKLLPNMDRKTIIAHSLKNRGALIKVKDTNEAIKIANQIAPEHLEIATENPQAIADKIQHAGAIFIGKYSCEAIGDYCAGPNHVLPTSTTARFSSPLGVYDFQKKSSIIMASKNSANTLGKIAATLAKEEGLQAHEQSALYRTNKEINHS